LLSSGGKSSGRYAAAKLLPPVCTELQAQNSVTLQLNDSANDLLQSTLARTAALRISISNPHQGTVRIVDFGIKVPGGLEAGLTLAQLCMAGLGDVSLQSADSTIDLPRVFVRTDHPVAACLQSQYAGWKIATDDYFAMGSGPMRATAATEDIFDEFPVQEDGGVCIGVLESGSVPTAAAIEIVRSAVGTQTDLTIAVAPTASQAGNLQVVARSVETAMHKLHELKFPVDAVVSGCGSAPLPPVAKNDLAGIGRTNDAILYGATVNLWVNCEDAEIKEVGPRTPSSSSAAHGRPFLDLFKEANHDFYALDKHLFSPAVVVFHNLKTGNSFRFGKLVPELLRTSFGM